MAIGGRIKTPRALGVHRRSGSTDMQRSVRLKSFELVARDINDVDVELLHALSISVRWPHRPKDWDVLRRAGHGIVAVDGIGRVFGSAMWFPHGDDFATIGLVITTPRIQAQGGGRWLMDQILEQCGDRNLALNATHAAYPLYVHSTSRARRSSICARDRSHKHSRRCQLSMVN
jgi:GNAT superfamily N-acetyltransferase